MHVYISHARSATTAVPITAPSAIPAFAPVLKPELVAGGDDVAAGAANVENGGAVALGP
jgi:hypothetical protein